MSNLISKEDLSKSKQDLNKSKLEGEMKVKNEFERKVKKDRGNYTFITERLDNLKVKSDNNKDLSHNRILPNMMTQFIVKKPESIVKLTSIIQDKEK